MSASGRLHKVDLSSSDPRATSDAADHERIVKMRREGLGLSKPTSERVGRLIEVSRAILRTEEDETLA